MKIKLIALILIGLFLTATVAFASQSIEDIYGNYFIRVNDNDIDGPKVSFTKKGNKYSLDKEAKNLLGIVNIQGKLKLNKNKRTLKIDKKEFNVKMSKHTFFNLEDTAIIIDEVILDKPYGDKIYLINIENTSALKKGLEKYNKVLAERNAKAKEYFDEGLNSLKQGKFDTGIELMTKAIELKSDYELAFFNRGLAYNQKQEFTQAIDDFTISIEINPRFQNYYMRGLVYQEESVAEYNKSINDLKKAVNKYQPDNADCYYNLGYAYLQQKSYDESINSYNKAISLYLEQPDSEDRQLTLKSIYRFLGFDYKDKGLLYESFVYEAISNLDKIENNKKVFYGYEKVKWGSTYKSVSKKYKGLTESESNQVDVKEYIQENPNSFVANRTFSFYKNKLYKVVITFNLELIDSSKKKVIEKIVFDYGRYSGMKEFSQNIAQYVAKGYVFNWYFPNMKVDLKIMKLFDSYDRFISDIISHMITCEEIEKQISSNITF